MAKRTLHQRLQIAAELKKGCHLSAADVAELMGDLASMGSVVAALQQSSILVAVPGEAIANLIADSLCLDLVGSGLDIDLTAGGWVLSSGPTDGDEDGLPLVDAIDRWRHSLGRKPLSSQPVVVPGTTIIEQLSGQIAAANSAIKTVDGD